MKVQDSNLSGTQASSAPPAGSVARQAGPAGQHSAKWATGDQVELSGVAGKLGATLAAQSADRASRLAALERDYQAGRYLPDAAATSRAVVNETLGATATGKGV